MSLLRHLRSACLPFILLAAACTAPTPRATQEVTLLAFGDGGYHYDHLEKKYPEAND